MKKNKKTKMKNQNNINNKLVLKQNYSNIYINKYWKLRLNYSKNYKKFYKLTTHER